MSRRKDYKYADARVHRTGTMICWACSNPINGGRYRYHQNSNGFVSCHESCCSDDPEWAEWDRRQAEHAERYAAFVQACREFRDKWGIDDLDDYIPEET